MASGRNGPSNGCFHIANIPADHPRTDPSNLQVLSRALPPTCRKLAALAEESSSATIAPFELLLFWCSHTDTKFSFWKHFSNGTFQLPRLWARNPAADQG